MTARDAPPCKVCDALLRRYVVACNSGFINEARVALRVYDLHMDQCHPRQHFGEPAP